MKMSTRECLVLPVLVGLGLLSGQLPAQTFRVVHTFTSTNSHSGEGGSPTGRLVASGNTLYGTTQVSGSGGFGTAYAVNSDGTGFATLHSFTGGNDGAYPWADLALSSNTLYGTASGGGSASNGTVFAVNTDGSGFRVLHSFSATSSSSPHVNSDGATPYSGLVLSGNMLYGTTFHGGSSGNGTVYAVNSDGTQFTVLHNFTALDVNNSDGGRPESGLVLSGNILYGTAAFGGASGGGTVFGVNTDGTGFRTLHSFTNSDGVTPNGGLLLSGTTLYGTTVFGGSHQGGSVFAVNTDGTGFSVLNSFTTSGTNAGAGANPMGSLVLSGNTPLWDSKRGGRFVRWHRVRHQHGWLGA